MRSKKGFTLVELAIVIVIIGLILAGILTGRNIVKQATLRAMLTDVNKYTIAINNFKLQYNALPGDFNNAVTYFGATTADGNGDGNVEWSAEVYRTWQHLSLAGLIEGSYTGTSVSTKAVAGRNVPKGPISGSAYNMTSHQGWQDATGFFQIMFGKENPGNTWADYAVLAPAQAYVVDAKQDNGVAGSGRIRGFEGAQFTPTATCATPFDVPTSQYIRSTTTDACVLIFKLD